MEKVRVHLYVDGYVQGVFFRAFTRNHAIQLDVKGWVKNLPDGRVEAVFEGDSDKVSEMIKLCEKGPTGSRVLNSEVQWEIYKGEFDGFSIRYGVDY